jgi:CheY-like chemotaxis protein/REP element-mobilizing transposase RayT
MTTRVLVVDANAAFATMIKQALEDLGEYRVTVAGAAPQAIGLAAQEPYDLAIVDMGLPDVSGEDTVRGLRATTPHLPVIVIPFGLDGGDAALESLDVQGTLNKPFFLPDLPGIVEQALEQPVGGVAPPPRARPRASQAASAPAPAPAAAQAKPDVGQIASLPHPRPATAPDWLTDAAAARRALAAAAPAVTAEAMILMNGASPVANAGALGREPALELAQGAGPRWLQGQGGRSGALMKYVRLATNGADYLLYAAHLAEDLWLALVYKAEAPVGLVRKQARQAVDALFQAPPQPPAGAEPETRPASPAPAAEEARPAPVTAPLPPETLFEFGGEAQPEDRPVDVLADTQPYTPVPLPPGMAVDMGLTLPAPPQAGGLPELAHASNALYSLTYTLAWAPKYPRTRLTGDIAGMLDEWIRHLALSYDWRVERVDVRPEYVGVILSCAPATAPEQMVNVLKRATSDKALAAFTGLAADHPGGDLWAPGYLLLSGSQSLTPGQVADFLAHTRRSQGLG